MLGLVLEAVLEEVSRGGSRAGAGPLRVAWEGRQSPACQGSPDRLIWAASILCNAGMNAGPAGGAGFRASSPRVGGPWGRVPGQLPSGRGAGGLPIPWLLPFVCDAALAT